MTLIRGDLRGVPQAIILSQATVRNIRQNLSWAFGYNVVLLPIAAGVLASFAWAPPFLQQLHPILARGRDGVFERQRRNQCTAPPVSSSCNER